MRVTIAALARLDLMTRTRLALALILTFGGACAAPVSAAHADRRDEPTPSEQQKGGAPVSTSDKVVKTDDEWRKILTPEQFQVLRGKGTERAFTGAFYASHDRAIYVCAACGQELFSSDAKFDSGTGWPSFTAPIGETKVETETDSTYGMRRVEVHCARCGGHLGHVFEDGPAPTGLRYCINSVSLKQVKK
jgi:peptide-methionine (R)-S-oxide reductase